MFEDRMARVVLVLAMVALVKYLNLVPIILALFAPERM
jgi:hypothetical protein